MFYDTLLSFVLVAEEENITRAAERLHLTQQSLSRQIAKLEEDYGMVFFERKPHFRLTSAGRAFYEHAQEILEREKSFAESLNSFRCQKKGFLSLGCTMIRAQTVLPRLLPLFSQRFPNIAAQVKVCAFQELDRRLLDGEFDLVIRAKRTDATPLVTTTDIGEDRLCLAVPWRFCGKHFPDMASAEAFNALPCARQWELAAATPLFRSIPYILAGPTCVKEAESFFRKYVPSPNVLLRLPETEPVLLLGFLDQAALISCKSIFDRFFTPEKSLCSFALLPLPHRQPFSVVLGYDKNRELTWEARQFIRFAEEEYL